MLLILFRQTQTLGSLEEHFSLLSLKFCHLEQAPGVRELQVDDVQHLLPVCAVVIIDKLLQLHLAVGLLGDVHHVHAHIRTFGTNGAMKGAQDRTAEHQNSEGEERPLLTNQYVCMLIVQTEIKVFSKLQVRINIKPVGESV